MSSFFVAILSGVAWMGLSREIGWGTFAVGAAVGWAVWRLEGIASRRAFEPIRALRLAGMGLRLFAVFLVELVIAALEQVRIILSPRIDVRPGWVRFRTELETPAMRVVLGLMLSLTPGSLIFEESVSRDGVCQLELHVLDLRDEARVIERIRQRFEKPLRRMETL
jgi:multisubunit Na+/H+ antiporter MnhE subunit